MALLKVLPGRPVAGLGDDLVDRMSAERGSRSCLHPACRGPPDHPPRGDRPRGYL